LKKSKDCCGKGISSKPKDIDFKNIEKIIDNSIEKGLEKVRKK